MRILIDLSCSDLLSGTPFSLWSRWQGPLQPCALPSSLKLPSHHRAIYVLSFWTPEILSRDFFLRVVLKNILISYLDRDHRVNISYGFFFLTAIHCKHLTLCSIEVVEPWLKACPELQVSKSAGVPAEWGVLAGTAGPLGLKNTNKAEVRDSEVACSWQARARFSLMWRLAWSCFVCLHLSLAGRRQFLSSSVVPLSTTAIH